MPDLKATLSMIQLNGAKGVILDMRDNPGGTLASAVDIASQFLTEGIVVYVVAIGKRRGRRSDNQRVRLWNWQWRILDLSAVIPC